MTEYTEVEIKQANADIANLIQQAYALLSQAETIADKYSLEFSFGVTYGAGATYYGKGSQSEWNSSDDDWSASDEEGWRASSEGC